MDLQRFLDAQMYAYDEALREIRAGYKYGHWIWYIIPMLYGVKRSSFCDLYGIQGYAEAVAYYQHPVLGARLTEITQAVLTTLETGRTLEEIFGDTDAKKTISCMTLFQIVGADISVQNLPYHAAFQSAAVDILAIGESQNYPSCMKTLVLLAEEQQ